MRFHGMKLACLAGVSIMLFNCQSEQSKVGSTQWLSLTEKDASMLQIQYGDAIDIQGAATSGLVLATIEQDLLGQVSANMHKATGRCGGFLSFESEADALEYQALQSRADNAPQASFEPRDSTLSDDQQASVIEMTDATNIKAFISKLVSYGSRYYESKTGVQSQQHVLETWLDLAPEGDWDVAEVEHSWQQPSIVAKWIGSENPEEIVVLGGHGDSIAMQFGFFPDYKNAPGADDNASGISTITEVIRVLSESGYQPKRTIHFMAYAAEEVGLKGSKDIAKMYKNNDYDVVAAMQLDMTNHEGTNGGEITFITDYVNDDATKFTQTLADDLKIDWNRDKCGYACSDHASWTDNGFPSVFPFESKFDDANSKIHTKNDTLANSDMSAEHAHKFAKLAAQFLMEMAF